MPKAMLNVPVLPQMVAGFLQKRMLPEQFMYGLLQFNIGLKQFMYDSRQIHTTPTQIIFGLMQIIHDSLQFIYGLKQTMHELKQNRVLLQRKHKHLFPDLAGWERKGILSGRKSA